MNTIMIITIIGNPPFVPRQPGQVAKTPSHLTLSSAIPAIKKAIANASLVGDITDEEIEATERQVVVAIPAMANSMSDLVVRLEGICLSNLGDVTKLWRNIARILWSYNKFQGEKIWTRIVLVSHGQQTVFDESPPPE